MRLPVSLLFLLSLWSCQQPKISSILIENVRIADGTGAPLIQGAVRIDQGKIQEMGKLQPKAGEQRVNGEGKVLAPGFIDTHSHHGGTIFEQPDAAQLLSQGITTIIVGLDGFSAFPVKNWIQKMDSLPVAVNMGTFIGHNTLRELAMSDYKRPADPAELVFMDSLLQTALEEGALGMSSGLEYDPGIYADPSEIQFLGKSLKKHNSRYSSHLRSEDRQLWAAVQEIIALGQATGIPVNISHIKLAMVDLWGQADSLIAILQQARDGGVDITADLYPYEYWQSTMTVLFPERNFDDDQAYAFALSSLTRPEYMIIANYEANPAFVGKTLAEIALERGEKPEKTYQYLIKTAIAQDADESIICKSMTESDIATLLQWPYTNICTDGSFQSLHPRGTGSFPRVLRQFVREGKQLSLEAAIRQMTAQAAENTGIKYRGRIAPDFWADLVLFDPEAITDHADFSNPHALSTGVAKVWVNGKLAWDGQPTYQFPGTAITSNHE
jgi:N-acyl-D-amino-acid deacylase